MPELYVSPAIHRGLGVSRPTMLNRLILCLQGVERVEREAAGAGEIVSIAGIKGGGVNVTLVSAREDVDWGEEGMKPMPVRDVSFMLSGQILMISSSVNSYRSTNNFHRRTRKFLSPCWHGRLKAHFPTSPRPHQARSAHGRCAESSTWPDFGVH